MFVYNINPKLKFIYLEYMTFLFIDIMHRLNQKEIYLMDINELKYGSPTKEIKRGWYKKKEDKEFHAIEEPQSKNQQKNQAKKISKEIQGFVYLM